MKKLSILMLAFASCTCQMPLGVVDRFEEDYVIIQHDSGTRVFAHVDALEIGVGEGDVVNPDLTLNEKETARRRAANEKLINNLLNK